MFVHGKNILLIHGDYDESSRIKRKEQIIH